MGFKPRRKVEYARSDGWVLAAAAHAGQSGVATWRAIIGSGDYMNRAVLTYDELAGAAARLDAGGLVRYRRDGLVVSPAVLALIDESVRGLSRRYAAVWALPVASQTPTQLPARLAREDYERAVKIHSDWG